MSLRGRLTVGTAAALALAIAVGLFAAYAVVRGQLRGEIDNSLRQRAAGFARLPHPPSAGAPGGPREPRFAGSKLGGAAGYFQIVTATGKTSRPSGETVRLPTAGARAVAAGTRPAYFSDATVAGTHVRIYTRHTGKGTAVQIARPLTEVDHALGRIRLLFGVISLLAVAGAALLGAFVARRTLLPVRRLTDDAERIATTRDLTQRADSRRSDELGRLAVAFNTMLDALAGSIDAQRQLVADASHELRTPLASARTNLEVMQIHERLPEEERRRMLGAAVDELREMTQLIEELVELARGDAQQPLVTERMRLDALVEDVVATARRRSGMPFDVRLEPSVVIGARPAVARAVSNLVDNALKWNLRGAAIEVHVAGGAVSVRDHGPGIDPVDLPHVFDRFYRAAAARAQPGSGLGLAIVRQVAEAHGGSVTVERADGGGARFTLRLASREPEDA